MKEILLICKLLVTIDGGGIPFLVQTDTEGKLIKESNENYLIDFSKGVKNYTLVGKPSDYSKVLISKDKCIKE